MPPITARPAAVPLLAALAAACAPAAPAPSPPPAPAPSASSPAPAAALAGCPEAAPALEEDGADREERPLGLKIGRVCVYGASSDTRPAVNDALSLRVGGSLSAEAVRDSLEQLTRLDSIDDARVGAEASGDAAIVHVVVRERPRISEVIYEPASARQPEGPADFGGRASPFALHDRAKAIEARLQQRGYGGARVAAASEPAEAGLARVRVKIELGQAWMIARVSFPGARAVPEADARAASAVALGSPWKPDEINVVALRVTSLYLDRGFVKVKVSEPERSVDASGGVSLSWKIEEGDRYSLGKLSFSGPMSAREQAALRARMKSRTGAIFNRSLVKADVDAMDQFLRASRDKEGRRGVSPSVTVDAKQKKIDIDFTVTIADHE